MAKSKEVLPLPVEVEFNITTDPKVGANLILIALLKRYFANIDKATKNFEKNLKREILKGISQTEAFKSLLDFSKSEENIKEGLASNLGIGPRRTQDFLKQLLQDWEKEIFASVDVVNPPLKGQAFNFNQLLFNFLFSVIQADYSVVLDSSYSYYRSASQSRIFKGKDVGFVTVQWLQWLLMPETSTVEGFRLVSLQEYAELPEQEQVYRKRDDEDDDFDIDEYGDEDDVRKKGRRRKDDEEDDF